MQQVNDLKHKPGVIGEGGGGFCWYILVNIMLYTCIPVIECVWFIHALRICINSLI